MGRFLRLSVIILGVFAAGAFCYFILLKQPRSIETPAPSSGQVKGEIFEEWHIYKPQSDRFEARLPAQPQHAGQAIRMHDGGGIIRYDMYVTQVHFGPTFMINVIEYPASFDVSDSDALLENAMKEIISGNPDNTLLKSSRDSFLGCPSLLFLVQNQQGSIKSRVVQKDHVIYVLSVADTTAENAETHFDKLIHSFKIK